MPPRQRNRLDLVRLEDRHAPATFTVTTAADNGTNVAPIPGSLREAILNANAAIGADVIAFNIGRTGLQTITPATPLPAVTDAVVIDATTAPGYTGTPLVRLSGAAAGPSADGLVLANHAGSTVKGFVIGGFKGAGVRVDGGSGHRIAANLIGLAAGGSAADANGTGVRVANKAAAVVVGGAVLDRNVISGNAGDGVVVEGGSQANIAANFIGTDGAGANAVPNAFAGVVVAGGSVGTFVGGFAAGDGNVIAGNAGPGVRVSDAATAGVTIAGNRIGQGGAGTALPNVGDGVQVTNAAGTAPAAGVGTGSRIVLRSNTIAQNTGNGVAIRDGSRFVTLDGNSISGNGGLGIAIDSGANGGAVAPQITGITTAAAGPLVSGTVTGRPNTAYAVALFSNSAADPSGAGEGQVVLTGGPTVTTNAGGTAPFTYTVPAGSTGKFITATATASDTGETSAFSNATAVPGSTVAASLFAVGAGFGGSPTVAVYQLNGTLAYTVSPFATGFTGGVRVSMADFTGDGNPDLVAGTGPGIATQVLVLDGVTKQVVFTTQPFEAAFTGGVYVATGDLNGDGRPDLVITPDEGGGPRCRVFNGAGVAGGKEAVLADFFGIDDPNFRGGARAAVGDVNGDGVGDLVVAAGFQGGPRVAGYTGQSVTAGSTPTKVFADFFAFEQTLRNGVFIAAGDLDGDGKAEVIAGGGPGGGPRVTAFSATGLVNGLQTPVANFFAGDAANRGGIRLRAVDLDSDGRTELITGPGPTGGSKASGYAPADMLASGTPIPRLTVDPFPGFTGGVYVG